MIPRVLSVAGTDPTGGAGIHADLKSIAAAGGYGMAAVTSLVAQNTCGVRSVHTPPPAFLREQLDAVTDDVEVDAVKIGMLGDVATVETVADWLPDVLTVLDPVMVATSGDRLLPRDVEEALRGLVAQAGVVTPNIPELAVLTGLEPATTLTGAVEQARRIASPTTAVVVKAGHLSGPDAGNVWVHPDGVHHVPSPRVDTTTTHGTGCSLSSALATRLVTDAPREALAWVTRWLHGAIVHGADLHVGRGHGPVHHGWATSDPWS